MRKFLLLLVVFTIPIVLLAQTNVMKKIAKSHAKKILKEGKSTVAVLLFPYEDGRLSSGSFMLSEQLGVDLDAIKGIEVVDRSVVRKKLRERNISQAFPIKGEKAAGVGKLIGADVVVVGTLVDKEDGQTEVVSRVYSSDNGKEIAIDEVRVKRTWEDSPRFPRRPVR